MNVFGLCGFHKKNANMKQLWLKNVLHFSYSCTKENLFADLRQGKLLFVIHYYAVVSYAEKHVTYRDTTNQGKH